MWNSTPKCLLKTHFPHIMCELIDAINEMEDVETHADNFMAERNLLVDEIKENYLEVLKPLRSAGGKAVKKRIEQCICKANHLEVPLVWCAGCEYPKADCNCDSTPRWCEYDCGNLVTKDNPCGCRDYEDGSSEGGFDSGDMDVKDSLACCVLLKVRAPTLMSSYTEAQLEEMRENSDNEHEDGRGGNDDGSDEDGGFISEEY